MADLGANPELLMLVLAYLRVQGCLVTLPAFSERSLSVRVRVGLAMALAPLLAAGVTLPAEVDLGAVMAGEILIGLVLGMLVRITAMMLTIAASAIAAAASLSQLFGADSEMSPHPAGNLLHLAGLALLMALGLPALVAALLGDSLVAWPPGQLPALAPLVTHGVSLIDSAFSLALVLASPFLLGGLLYQALSGIVNRAMPAFPILLAAAPGAILLALAGLVILSGPILGLWADAVLGTTIPDLAP